MRHFISVLVLSCVPSFAFALPISSVSVDGPLNVNQGDEVLLHLHSSNIFEILTEVRIFDESHTVVWSNFDLGFDPWVSVGDDLESGSYDVVVDVFGFGSNGRKVFLGDWSANTSLTVNPVPEPASIALSLFGLGSLGLLKRRSRKV